MKCCGFNNGITISSIDDEDLQHFVNEVKNGNVSEYFSKLIGNTADVLQGSMKTKDDFEFSRGHLKFLKAIVEFLKKYGEENGWDSFSIQSVAKRPNDQNAPVANKKQKRVPSNPSNIHVDTLLIKNLAKQKGILWSQTITSLLTNAYQIYIKVRIIHFSYEKKKKFEPSQRSVIYKSSHFVEFPGPKYLGSRERRGV